MNLALTLQSTSSSRRRLVVLLLLAFAVAALWLYRLRPQPDLASAPLSVLAAEVRAHPDNADALYYLGIRLQELGQIERAHAILERAATNRETEPIWLAWAATATGPTGTNDARLILTEFLKNHAESVRAHLALGQVYRRLGSHSDAFQEAVIATRLDPRETDAWKLRGGEAAALAQWSEAEQSFRQALILRPSDWRTQLALGEVLQSEARTKDAVVCFREASRLAPQEPLARRTLGRVLLLSATTPEEKLAAQSVLQEANAATEAVPSTGSSVAMATSQSISPVLRDADMLLMQKRWKEAERAFRTLLAANPNSAEANEGVGRALAAQNRREEAFPYLDKATQQNPQLPDAQGLLGVWFNEVGLVKEAARRLQRATLLRPADAALWHELGMAYSKQDIENQKAEAAFRRAVELDPIQVEYWMDLADALALNSKIPEAEAAYRRAVQLGPQNADALSRLGAFLMNTRYTPERGHEAEQLLQEALVHNPANDFALYHLGRLASNHNQNKQAAFYLARAARLTPDVSEIWYALALVYSRLGDEKRASLARAQSQRLSHLYSERTRILDLVNIHPRDLALRLQLAELFEANGENAKALDEYAHCLRLDPHNTMAMRNLRNLQTRLKAEGHLPDMTLFYALIRSAARDQS